MAIVRTDIGANLSATGGTLVVTVPAGGVPAGSLIVVAVIENNTTGTIGTIADTAGNTYTKITDKSPNNANANGRAALFYVKNCLALVSGNSITYTKISTGLSTSMSAFYATGVDRANPLDTAVTNFSTASSSSPTVTTGTPSRHGELFVGVAFWKGNATYTEDSAHNWAGLPTGAVNPTLGHDGGNQVQTSPSTIVFNPTISASLVNCALVAGFKQLEQALPPFRKAMRFFTRRF